MTPSSRRGLPLDVDEEEVVVLPHRIVEMTQVTLYPSLSDAELLFDRRPVRRTFLAVLSGTQYRNRLFILATRAPNTEPASL